jgi:hypothetical protein
MTLRLRPRFEVATAHPPEQVIQRLRSTVERPDAPWPGRVFADHAVVHVPPAEQHIWSPFLSLDLHGHEDGSLVRGTFGPKPSIWTLFAASYAACGFSVFFAVAYAASQWLIGEPAWALAAIPVAVLGAACTYAAALYGQHKGREQMDGLRAVLDRALGADTPDATA